MAQDLTIPLPDGKLNIRVAIWLEHEEKLLVSEYPNGIITLPGGRVKFNEASSGAALRELYEETGEQLNDIALYAIIENFFTLEQNFHEILYVYRGSIPYKETYEGLDCDDQKLYWLSKTEIHKLKPLALTQLVHNPKDVGVIHIINRD